MNQARKIQAVGGGKKAASQIQSYGVPLVTGEAKTCTAYLSAIGCQKNASGWSNPPGKELPDSFSIVTASGLPTATIKEKAVSGYDLVTWLILGSAIKGTSLIKMGALILLGIHELRWFEVLKGYDQDDPQNSVLRVMKVVAVAASFVPETAGESEEAGSDLASVVPLNSLAAPDDSDLNTGSIPEDGPGDSGRAPQFRDHPENHKDAAVAKFDPTNDAPEPPAIVILEDQPASEDGDDFDALDATDYISSDDIDESDIPALLKAFNGGVMSAETCVKRGRRNVSAQFCYEIELGRLLVQKKQDEKTPTSYFDWKAETFPDAEWAKAFLSRCFRYGVYEQRMKSKRGLLLQDIDVKNCKKKAMLLIGGYKKKNAEDLVNAVCALLDGGKVVDEVVASKLVHKFSKKLEKPNHIEAAQPAVPTTVHELFELPKKCLSSYGKKHLAEFHQLLEAIERVNKSQHEEAALVLPLVRMFTIF